MLLDQGRALGWNPPWFNEQAINTGLWSLMRTAARNAKLTKREWKRGRFRPLRAETSGGWDRG